MRFSKLKILIVNTSDISGGAARAAYRLLDSLTKIGIQAEMLVQKKESDDHRVIKTSGRIEKALDMIRPFFDRLHLYTYGKRKGSIFSPSWVPSLKMVKTINQSDADIVHLHWVNGGMIRIEDLKRINKPIVWTLHDMWPFTGGCHYDEDCGQYEKHCTGCPVLGTSKIKDLSFRVFKRKIKTYEKMNQLTIVGLSDWLAKCAANSRLFKEKQLVRLPNPIDTEIFKPIKKEWARYLLNIPQQSKIVLYGAMSATSEPRKGYQPLMEALSQIDTENLQLVVFGASKPQNDATPISINQYYLGRIHDNLSLQIAYSAADVMVVPSLQENLSNTIMESLSCGTPVVGFRIGGNPDMIEHQKNGYLAEPFCTEDLAKGIEWVLNHSNPNILSQNAREKVINCFEMTKVAKRYQALYKEILSNKH